MNVSPSPGAITPVFIKSQVVFSDFSRPSSFSIFLSWLLHEVHASSGKYLSYPPDVLSFCVREAGEGDPRGVKTTALLPGLPGLAGSSAWIFSGKISQPKPVPRVSLYLGLPL